MPTRSTGGERRRRKPTKTGVVLTEKLIIETALQMLRLHGGAGLSARRLGLALGADPTAVYRYFSSIEDLKLAIADELIDRSAQGWEPSGEWKRDLRDFGLRTYASYVADPQSAILAASRVTGRPNETAAVERMLGVLRAAGFDAATAATVYLALINQILGFVALDAAMLALPEESRRVDDLKWQSVYAHLPAQAYPNIAAVADRLVEIGSGTSFPVALDLMLDGVELMLARGE
jgi:AcrR family transcriptional regulator